MQISTHVFFRAGSLELPPQAFNRELRSELWKPSLTSIWPRGATSVLHSWLFRWLLHMNGLYVTREYCALVVRHKDRIVHYSVVCPKSFRTVDFPDGDLHIGPTWTDSNFRRRGIASRALLEIRYRLSCPGRQFHYYAMKHNTPSHLAAIRAGFSPFAEGRGIARFGLSLFRKYAVTSEGVPAFGSSTTGQESVHASARWQEWSTEDGRISNLSVGPRLRHTNPKDSHENRKTGT